MYKKFILFFLVVSVLLLSPISCTKENNENPQNSYVDSPAPQIDSEIAFGEETTSIIKDNLADKFDFGVDKVNILNWSDTEHVEFFSENLNGEVVNDAIYNRNITLSARLGVELNFIGTPGNTSNIQNYVTKYANSYNAGEKAYDVLSSYSRTMSTVAQQGYCMDMTKIDYIDLDMPWWPESLYDEANINGALYFASGDISINMLYMMYAVIVNLDIAEEFKLPDLFEIVNNGEWTWEKMQELIRGTYIDLNNSGSKDDADRFGFVVSTIHVDSFYFGADLKFIEHAADGSIILSPDFTSERAINLIDKVNALLWNTSDGYYGTGGTTGRDIFSAGRTLFVCDRGPQVAAKMLTSVQFSYAMLPTPKYDKEQENYITTLAFPFTFYAIPVDARSTELSGAFIECFASEGYRQVTPALFEITIKLKYAETKAASEMYDIIRKGVSFDLGRVYATAFDGVSYSVLRTCISGNNNIWISSTKAITKTFDISLKKLLEAFK